MSIQKKHIDSDIRIEQMMFISPDTVFLCGGIKGETGQIFMSVDKACSWQKVYEGPDKIYSLEFWNGNDAIAVGDCTHIQRSYDRGLTWPREVATPYFIDNDQTSFRKVHFYNGISGIATGNLNRERGNSYWTWDGGLTWTNIHGGLNGLEDWWIFGTDSVYACGFGILENISDFGKKVTVLPFSGDYFTGIWFVSDSVGYMCGYDGGIYKTSNSGACWETVFKKNSLMKKRVHFNDIVFVDEKLGFVCGEGGLLVRTTDAGGTWETVDIPTSRCLSSMLVHERTLFVCSEGGDYYRVEL